MRKLNIKNLALNLASRISKIMLMLLTFTFGVLSPIFLSEISPTTVTICQLAQNPSLYNWRTIQIEADGRGGTSSNSIIIEDSVCQVNDAWASVSIKQNVELSEDARKLFTESDSEFSNARVSLVGRFDANYSMGCFGPKFGIETTNIQTTSLVTNELIPKRSAQSSSQMVLQ